MISPISDRAVDFPWCYGARFWRKAIGKLTSRVNFMVSWQESRLYGCTRFWIPHRTSVRYPTCLRMEISSNANTISAQHPNSETRIKITHGFPSPYDKITAQTLSIYWFSIPLYLFPLFMTRSALVSRLWSFISAFLRFSDSSYHMDSPSTLSVVCGPLSSVSCDISYPWTLATSRYNICLCIVG